MISVVLHLGVVCISTAFIKHPSNRRASKLVWPRVFPERWSEILNLDEIVDEHSSSNGIQLSAYERENRVVKFTKVVIYQQNSTGTNIFVVERMQAGFPLKMLYSWRYKSNTSNELTIYKPAGFYLSGLEIGSTSATSNSMYAKDLPIAILYKGFVINVAMTMMLLVFLSSVFKKVIKHNRLKKNNCLICSYSREGLSGEVCPECGSALYSE
ncbi:MAG: hypothetical protein P1U42_03690 [Phycisphaerales bacterium]|nr:hypothetical protein [Phycisphaerales bacterium]